ncbi:hypothetical protein [Neomoorella mulderi]|uniref:Formiminotransferase C-terminal subdomain domain-containing protein n=1 Tax=Moorella mulderi DSM 14980 TaxID=1122241 RepID=A0A151B259_9FIRM|nr:hypothetical protein [Moorella mulderi]KYH33873.1 hypothetical protein MOMUL_05910 [Moorella mulderi DSM 14980]
MKALDYTLYLGTDDVRVAYHLARVLTQKGGGAISARGQEAGRQTAVVVHILDWQAFPLLRVLETVRVAARSFNVQVSRGVLGPAPREAILEVARQALLLDSLPVIAGPDPGESAIG